MANSKRRPVVPTQRRVNPAYERPFEVSAQSIANLTSEQFVAFAAFLIRAEIAAYGGSADDLLGNFALGPDGGRDATTVRSISIQAGDDFVPFGETVWQCKAEQRAPEEHEFADELSKEKPLACLSRGGRYLFLAQKPHTDEDETEAMLKGIAFSNGLDEDRVQFFAQTKLAEFARRHPSLSLLSFFPVRPSGLEPFELWDASHPLPFEPSAHSAKLQEIIAGIRPGRFHVAVTGPTGVGKSRIVLEAIRHLALVGFVAYSRSHSPAVDALVDHIRMHRLRCILVVDECDEANASVLREKLAPTSSGLITIGADREGFASRPPQGDSLIRLKPLPNEVVSKVLEGIPGLDADARSWVATHTGGFIKLARLVGEEVARDARAVGNLAHMSAATEVERALSRMLGNDEKKVRLLKLLACFSAIDHTQGPSGSELATLAERLQLSVLQFEELTARAKKEQILADTGNVLYVTPDLLAQWLLESFLTVHSSTFTQWLPGLPERLRDAHLRQLERLRGSPGGRSWAAELVSSTGPFGDLLARRQPWADYSLLALSAAAKEAAVEYISDWSQRTPDAPEQIAQRPSLQSVLFRVMRSANGFAKLFGLLLDAFAAAGAPSNGGVWQLLQGMMIATPLSSTLASYKTVVDRVTIEFSQRDQNVRAGLVRALGGGLVSPTGDAYSEYDREPDDNGRPPTPLEPIRAALALLRDALDDANLKPREAAAEFFVHSARSFINTPLEAEYFSAVPSSLSISGDIGTLAQELDAVIAYDAPPPDVAARIRALRTKLADNLQSRVRLVMGGWPLVDSADDGAVRPDTDSVADEIVRLSDESVVSVAEMVFEPWAKNPGALLFALAKRPGSERLWKPLLAAGRTANNAWPCALFLASARDEKRAPVPDVMSLMAGERFDLQVAAMAITMSTSSDAEVEGLASLLAQGAVEPSWTHSCYMGRWNERVSSRAVISLVEGLVSHTSGSSVAVTLCFRALGSKQPIPTELVVRALTTSITQVSGHDKWTWERVGAEIARSHPIDLFNALFDVVLQYGAGRADNELESVLAICCEQAPPLAGRLLELWDTHPYFVTHKLGALICEHVEPEKLIEWAKLSDRHQFAVGEMVVAANTPLTVLLVETFGENSRLASAIAASAGSGSWTGNMSGFYQSRGEQWIRYADDASTPRFKKFAQRVGRRFLASAKQARVDEAKEEAFER